jgi:hypothetical protein
VMDLSGTKMFFGPSLAAALLKFCCNISSVSLS